MSKVPHRSESTGSGAALYMALELGAQRWQVAFGVGVDTAPRRRTVAVGDATQLQAEIAAAKTRLGVSVEAPVRSCYEAGRDGFWIDRFLETLGVTNLVVDSSSIQVSRRQRQAKTDRLDAARLLQLLARHWRGDRDVWRVVHVPSAAQEDARHAERGIGTLTQERTRWRNRIHALLAQHGVRRSLTARFGDQLETLTDWAGAPLPTGVQARLRQAWGLLGTVEHALRQARRAQQAERRAAVTAAGARAARLAQLVSIRTGTALLLAKEVFCRNLQNRRQVGALSGLVSVPYQSGTAARDQGISRAGLRRVRGVLVELAWVWVRWQPDSVITQWFVRRFADGGARARRIGIVAVARKLLIALWHYSEHDVLPAGARLRA